MIDNAISLFAGVGGFDLALVNNDIKVIAQVEIDKHAQSVLKKQFPGTLLLGDIGKVRSESLLSEGFNPQTGIIVGGFPCQDVSVAGKRAGLAGERSGLFFQALRLIKETRPKGFIIENVPGLLTSNKGADMHRVISELSQLGYSLAWRVLDSQFHSVPQRRKRVFIVGYFGDNWRTPSEILNISSSRARYIEESEQQGKPTPAGLGGGVTGPLQARDSKGIGSQYVEENKLVYRVSGFADYKEGVGTLRASGGDIGLGSENLIIEATRRREPSLSVISPTLTSFAGTGGGNVPYVKMRMAQSSQDFETWGQREVAPTINSFDVGDVRSTVLAIQSSVIGRKDKNGPQGKGHNEAGEPMFTLTSTDRHAIPRNGEIRRLTPLEFERLQGFPDNWTVGQSDGHRYKQMGNAVTVTLVDQIIKRVKEFM